MLIYVMSCHCGVWDMVIHQNDHRANLKVIFGVLCKITFMLIKGKLLKYTNITTCQECNK